MDKHQIKYLRNLAGKYSKQALFAIENTSTNPKDIRKAILDAFNDYGRELEKLLGGEIET